MTPEAAKALEASIKHWEENAVAERPEDASTQGSDCALCAKFNREDDDETYCIHCPVFKHTNKRLCAYTHYLGASLSLHEWKNSPTEHNRLAFQARARKEVEFLKSLREPQP